MLGKLNELLASKGAGSILGRYILPYHCRFDSFKEGVGRLHSRVLQVSDIPKLSFPTTPMHVIFPTFQSEEALKKIESKTEKYSSREANFAAELTKLFSLEQEVKTR